MRCITLTTDFGNRDWFVGTMKGVLLHLAPRTAIVDLTHEVPPGGIRAGAFALAASYAFFPANTIHLVVVDPGVGSPRGAIAVQTRRYLFVGPDNGVLSWALAGEDIRAIHSLENKTYFLPAVSATFHGRDIFAPVAAHLSRGLPLRKVGPPLKSFLRLALPEPTQSGNHILGEVLYIDHFGNAITNISSSTLSGLEGEKVVFQSRKRLCTLAPFYQAVAQGKPVAVVGSSGFLEIAINGGSAAQRFGLRVGSNVTVGRNTAM